VHGRNAWAVGVGERLTPLDLPPAAYLLVAPNEHISTAALFSAPELTRNANPATMEDFISGIDLGNAFEPVVRQRSPAVEAAWQALSAIGSPRLTGTGSGCFVEFLTREAAASAQRRLPPTLPSRVVNGAARSPLLDVLEMRTT